VIIGDGLARRELEALAAELGVADRLHLPGAGVDLGAALDAMTLCVDLSGRRGPARGLLLAMAAGVPATEAGWMAAELAAVLGDRGRLRRLGEAGRDVVRERFSPARVLDAWETLLLDGERHG